MQKLQGTLNYSTRHEYEPGNECPSISLAMSERETSDSVWRVQVEARLGSGAFVLGDVLTRPRRVDVDKHHGARVVLIASCPGAVGWAAKFSKVGGTLGMGALVHWADSPCCMPPGLHPVNARPMHPVYRFNTSTIAGGASAYIQFLNGERIRAVHCWQVGDGGFFTIQHPVGTSIGGPVTPPPDGSASLVPEGDLWAPVRVEFLFNGNVTGKGGWLVEWEV